VPLVLFSVAGMPPEAVAEALSADGIAVRAGLHCAPAAHRKLGTAPLGAVRAAVGVFTDGEDVRFLCKKVALLTKKGLQTDGFMVQ
jgi:selenocysteine lyase/cysteine desulfurase